MARLRVANLPDANQPVLGSDLVMVSRDGTRVDKVALSDLPLSDAVLDALEDYQVGLTTVSFSSVLSFVGRRRVPQKTVDSAIHFTVFGISVVGSTYYMRLLADGVNVPTFDGAFRERNDSTGYINTYGVVNIIEIEYDGYDYLYKIVQRKSDYAGSGSGGLTISVTGVTNASATEGGNLVHTVSLSGTTVVDTVFGFSISDVTTSGTGDYSGSYTFSDGVTRSGNNLTVPAGVSGFTVTVATVNDATSESTELYTITVGGVSATGTINDNDASGSGETISTPTTSKSGVFTTITFVTSSPLRAAVEFGATTSYGTAVSEDFGTSTTTHSIVLEANANPLLSPHGLQTGQTYNLRAMAGASGSLVSPNITFVA